MPDFPLTLQHFLWRSTTLFPTKEIVTRREVGRHRYTYADFGRRVAQLAHAVRMRAMGRPSAGLSETTSVPSGLVIHWPKPAPLPEALSLAAALRGWAFLVTLVPAAELASE